MLTQSIAARGGEARPQRAQTTNETDRSGCPAGQHGTRWARAHHNCTCSDAYLASYRYFARWRAGIQPAAHVDATGTSRRLQALAAVGWSAAALGGRLGCTGQAVSKLRGQRRVHRDTARRVADLYAALAGQPVPDTVSAKQARETAARNGWARPEHWDGVDIDDPAATSDLDHQRDDARTGITGDDIAWLSSDAGGQLTDEQIADRYDLTVDEVGVLRRGAAISASRSQLTADDVYTIRDRWLAARAAGHPDPRPALAIEYGIGKCTVLDILTGRTWPHLQLTDILGDTGRGRPRKSASRHQYRPAS